MSLVEGVRYVGELFHSLPVGVAVTLLPSVVVVAGEVLNMARLADCRRMGCRKLALDDNPFGWTKALLASHVFR